MAFCGVLVLVGSRFGYAEPGVTLRDDLLAWPQRFAVPPVISRAAV